MKKFLATSVAVGLSVAALVGAPAHAANTTLTLGIISPLSDWRASSGQLANLGPFYQAVYGTLLTQSADGHTITSGLASYKYDKTQTVLTLTLQKGLKFTDGEALDATAVKTNLDGYSKGLASDASTATANIVSVDVKGATTVIITLKQPTAPFLNYLAGTLGMMEAPNAIASADAKSVPVGAGPYIYDAANSVAGSSYAFKANPGYWDKKHVSFPNLILKSITSNTAAVTALQSGQVDGINLLDMTAIDPLKAQGKQVALQYLNEVGIFFIDKAGRMGSPFKNLKVRQAINYAMDRDAAVKVFAAGFGRPTQQEFATFNQGFVPALQNTYTHDVAKAKQLMADAGYANGFTTSFPRFAGTPQTQVDFVTDQLAQIGITVKWDSYATVGDMFNAMWAPKYAAYRMTLQRDSLDLQLIDFKLARDAAWNPSGYGDATSDKLIALARTTTGKTQVKALQDLNKYITAQAWTAPLIETQVAFGFNPQTVNVKPHNGNALPYLLEITPAK
jgi:peptide/nickel transport system substrate-binding protein